MCKGVNIYFRTNSDLCHLQHKLIGFYNRDEKCLQRGTDCVFKYSGLRLVCKGLKLFIMMMTIRSVSSVPQPKRNFTHSPIYSKSFKSTTFRREELTAESIRSRKFSWARAEAVWAHNAKLIDDPRRSYKANPHLLPN